jgi:hypothetical protein
LAILDAGWSGFEVGIQVGQEQRAGWMPVQPLLGEGARGRHVALGYESESAFSTAFKRVMGCSPRQYGRGAGKDTSDTAGQRHAPEPLLESSSSSIPKHPVPSIGESTRTMQNTAKQAF